MVRRILTVIFFLAFCAGCWWLFDNGSRLYYEYGRGERETFPVQYEHDVPVNDSLILDSFVLKSDNASVKKLASVSGTLYSSVFSTRGSYTSVALLEGENASYIIELYTADVDDGTMHFEGVFPCFDIAYGEYKIYVGYRNAAGTQLTDTGRTFTAGRLHGIVIPELDAQ